LAAHGKEGAHGSVGSARQRWRRTAKGFAVHSLHAHGKGGFPSKPLPCKLCRECTHGKAFAVRIGLFAVQSLARQRLLFRSDRKFTDDASKGDRRESDVALLFWMLQKESMERYLKLQSSLLKISSQDSSPVIFSYQCNMFQGLRMKA
jgi:hypothetical protein